MRKVKRIQKQCEVCEKDIFLLSSYLKQVVNGGRFCSHSCKAKSIIAGWNKGLSRTWKNLPNGHTIESRKKIGIGSKGRWAGEKNPNWRGGIDKSKERNLEMHKLEYVLWRKAVYERDGWTCVSCGYKGRNIEADHIKPWSLYPELRFAIDNGRTLCRECHMQTDTWGTKIFFHMKGGSLL